MANVEDVLPSGAKLVITTAPFADASALLDAILKELRGMRFGGNADIDPANPGGVFKDPSSFMAGVDRLLTVATSDEVKTALFKCCERCSYEGMKVTRALFDDPKYGDQAREDYFTLAAKVVEVNCKPFFKQTFSGLKGIMGALNASPKSPSTPVNP